MHFSIPETKEVKEGNGSSYIVRIISLPPAFKHLTRFVIVTYDSFSSQVYSIYINGVFHCDMRYSQLHSLNEQLKQAYGSQALPFFPPKKFFPLSKTQLEERQFCLEKYLQAVSQQNELVNCNILRRFLFVAQQKFSTKWHNESDLTVWLLNGTQVVVKVTCEDSSEVLLQVNMVLFYLPILSRSRERND